MNLLFKREQTPGTTGRVTFKLWAKTELDQDEARIVQRYNFDQAKLIEVLQPNLLRQAIVIGVAVLLVSLLLLGFWLGVPGALTVGTLLAIASGYLFYDRNRESVFVRDLIHGRHFACDSVVDLARKEAWLETVVAFLRQVMESAKHWDGTEIVPIEALSKQEAKYIVIKGL
jgi:hypothetical protein